MLNTDTKLLISDYNKEWDCRTFVFISIRLLQFLNKNKQNVNKYISDNIYYFCLS